MDSEAQPHIPPSHKPQDGEGAHQFRIVKAVMHSHIVVGQTVVKHLLDSLHDIHIVGIITRDINVIEYTYKTLQLSFQVFDSHHFQIPNHAKLAYGSRNNK